MDWGFLVSRLTRIRDIIQRRCVSRMVCWEGSLSSGIIGLVPRGLRTRMPHQVLRRTIGREIRIDDGIGFMFSWEGKLGVGGTFCVV